MAVPTLAEQRRADIARFYAADLPNICSAETPAVSEAFLVRMEYPAEDQEGDGMQRQTAWMQCMKTDWPAPAYRDSVTVSGAEWRVAWVNQADAWQWRMKLEKNVRVGFGG